ncbi:lactonase family protein [Echinicola jeungdonensis]|uniref:Lactonase family protein n=1 Tax=Echinicola jeungdonensis TaxID=709343 RepID=A0ABV5J5R8_9BACT|nr:lactonase family protein [Echinicola jeungdonensis]MDN3671010.1 lactonase family protein [Echinicola jeungdonensis]
MKTNNLLLSGFLQGLMQIPIITGILLNFFSCQNPDSDNQDRLKSNLKFWVGTYTSQSDQGIHLIELNPKTNDFDSLLLQNGINNPSFVISNQDQSLLFSVQESGGDIGGSVCSFHFDGDSLKLHPINSVSTLGSGPCYISLSPDEKYLLAANYRSGDLAVIPVLEDGTLGEALQKFKHKGNSINPNRQEKPHVHSIVFHPDGKRFLVGDLGTDRIYCYETTMEENSPFKAATPPYYEVKAGSGPRHLVFNHTGNKFYLIHELTAEVGLYSYVEKEDKIEIEHLATYPLAEDDFSGEVSGAEIKISNDGKYLYASNRGEANQIIVFEIDQKSGKLNKIQTVSSEGQTPRNFTLSRDGNYLLVGNQNSNEIVLMDRNRKTGKIQDTKVRFPIHKPVYFYEIENK